MIASIRGTVTHIGCDSAILEVAGIGYRVFATADSLAGLRHGAEATLATSLVVREDSLTLFGFGTVEARDMYETLQTVSGVGPRLALAMLSVYEADDLRRIVAEEDLRALRKVPGIGEKGAKRIVLELTGKLGAPTGAAAAGAAAQAAGPKEDIMAALVGLGWNAKAAESAVDGVLATPNAPTDPASILKSALLTLGGKN